MLKRYIVLNSKLDKNNLRIFSPTPVIKITGQSWDEIYDVLIKKFQGELKEEAEYLGYPDEGKVIEAFEKINCLPGYWHRSSDPPVSGGKHLASEFLVRLKDIEDLNADFEYFIGVFAQGSWINIPDKYIVTHWMKIPVIPNYLL